MICYAKVVHGTFWTKKGLKPQTRHTFRTNRAFLELMRQSRTSNFKLLSPVKNPRKIGVRRHLMQEIEFEKLTKKWNFNSNFTLTSNFSLLNNYISISFVCCIRLSGASPSNNNTRIRVDLQQASSLYYRSDYYYYY